MSVRNRTSRLAGEPGVFVQQYGRKARKTLDPNDRRSDRDVERAMRRLSAAELSGLLADEGEDQDEDGNDDAAERPSTAPAAWHRNPAATRSDVQSRAMNALRRFLLRQGVARQLLWGVLLVTLLSRALMSGAVMLDPDGPDAGSVVLCSGRGPLIVDVAALAARFDAGAPITPANDAFALADALKHGAHVGNAASSAGGDDGLCAFGAALFTALASFAVLVLLFPAAAPRRFRIRFDIPRVVRSIFDDRPPSRAPPLFC